MYYFTLRTNLTLAAHGLKGQITFETAYGKLHPIFAKDLMDIFCAGGRAANVQLVFVSACHSEDVSKMCACRVATYRGCVYFNTC